MIKKIHFVLRLFLCLFVILFFKTNAYSAWWYPVEQINGFIWLNDDFSYPTNCWCLIDDDNDGFGYYYYFDEVGKLLIDTITPDYRIVDAVGRRTLLNGEPERIDMNEELIDKEAEEERKFFTSAEKSVSNFGVKSEAVIGNAIEDNNMSPALQGVENKYMEGSKNKIIGKNVVLKEKEEVYDNTIDKSCVKYINSGSNYSKKVNGTTFSKIKWKGVIALKGNESYFDLENPKNNFNRIRGKIATHYFTYSDRTTMCKLIVTDERGYELYTSSSFNYNNGSNIDFIFPKKTNKLRFELSVDGEYTSRVVYIKDLNYLFNKRAYDEEHEEDLEEEAFQNYRREMGLIDEIEDEIEYEEELENDTEDDEESDHSSSDSSSNDSSHGPAFDNKLKKATTSMAGPAGTNSIRKSGGSSD